jgi:HK97 family phage portal protein
MSVFGDLLGKPKMQAQMLPLTDPKPWREAGLLRSSPSGVSVTPDSAMTYSAVLACVRVLAETLASLPLITYERQGNRKERARDFYLYPLLHDEPNPWLTSFEFRELLQVYLLLWGNAYCEIEYDGAGRILALWPLLPWKMREIKAADGELVYKYELENGRLTTLPGWRIWHLRGLGFNGVIGYAISELSREPIALGLAAERYGGTFFGNGAIPGGVLEHPGVLGDDAHKHLRESWTEAHGGLERAHRIAILEEGLKYHATGVPPEEAQFLETRKYQRTEIAGILRVPPHMIGDLEHATFSNIEHQQIAFVVHTMRPWLVRWEQSIFNHLLTRPQQQQFFVEFLIDGLLRGDILSRYQAYAVGRQWGWLSADDVRERENMNPLPGGQGQTYLTPLNMLPADEAGEQGSRGAGEQAANPHYRLIVEEAAGRVVRKEIAAMSRVSEKVNGSADSWETAVTDFFADHAEFVAQTMRISLEAAVSFCNNGKWELLTEGAGCMADWPTRRVQKLADMAVNDE